MENASEKNDPTWTSTKIITAIIKEIGSSSSLWRKSVFWEKKSKYAHICLHESELQLLHVTHTPCKVKTTTDTEQYALLPNFGFPQEKKEQKDKILVAYFDM